MAWPESAGLVEQIKNRVSEMAQVKVSFLCLGSSACRSVTDRSVFFIL